MNTVTSSFNRRRETFNEKMMKTIIEVDKIENSKERKNKWKNLSIGFKFPSYHLSKEKRQKIYFSTTNKNPDLRNTDKS
jgi:hypothetical protein